MFHKMINLELKKIDIVHIIIQSQCESRPHIIRFQTFIFATKLRDILLQSWNLHLRQNNYIEFTFLCSSPLYPAIRV